MRHQNSDEKNGAMQPYTEQFYQGQTDGSRRSAKEIVPLVLELIQPKSVIDVGCGAGTWLSVFKELGIDEVFGIDGNYVNEEILQIPKERFLAVDLKNPIQLDRRFDLVVSLEVAEHLPEECAETFVDSLIGLGPVILFSAAIPFQGGTHHLNERWPAYWAKYFQEKEYVVIDTLRKKIWQNDYVEWWYAQNILMFARRDYLESHSSLKRASEQTTISQLSLVHPRKYLEAIGLYLTAQDIAKLIPLRDAFILVDQAQFGIGVTGGRCAIPFLESDGQYWGPPPDDMTAIHELERLRKSGATFVVFGWPAFWWLDYYTKMHDYLRSEYHCVLKNDRLVIFDLRR